MNYKVVGLFIFLRLDVIYMSRINQPILSFKQEDCMRDNT